MALTKTQKMIKKFAEDYDVNNTKSTKVSNGVIHENSWFLDFWDNLLSICCGLSPVQTNRITQKQVKTINASNKSSTNYIDIYFPNHKVIVEHKSSDKNLQLPQSSHAVQGYKGTLGLGETPFEQCQRYNTYLKSNEKADWFITSNFTEINIYDLNDSDNIRGVNPINIKLTNLFDEYKKIQAIFGIVAQQTITSQNVNHKAGKVIRELFDGIVNELKNQGIIIDDNISHQINVLIVRLVFCFYAEDVGLFPNSLFGKYLLQYKENPQSFQNALSTLFEWLSNKNGLPFITDQLLKQFPYVNGGLFKDKIGIPPFNASIIDLILKTSFQIDWSGINPIIFGAMFESTLNPETHSQGGMVYTSVQNIEKIINPLFMDDLENRYTECCQYKQQNKKFEELDKLHNYIASLVFLDPACGSGNFLSHTYIRLRDLENRIIQQKYCSGNQTTLPMVPRDEIKVKLNQFYGIEIHDFACKVAETSMWIAEYQMYKKIQEAVYIDDDFLPLHNKANIACDNALRVDWLKYDNQNTKIKTDENYTHITWDISHSLNYIMGNPPFVGARNKKTEQSNDVDLVWNNTKNKGELDYVTCWYKLASKYIQNSQIKCAFVSTNSICQGEQAIVLWKDLFNNGIEIFFAYQTFIWDSFASIKANVYCVIVGIESIANQNNNKFIIDSLGNKLQVNYINQYLYPFKASFISSRNTPISSNVPNIGIGNKPIDNGNYLFTEQEKIDFINKVPNSAQYFKKWIGADEFINNYCRWCLYLGNTPFSVINTMPLVKQRVDNVRVYRQNSSSEGTRKIAQTPTKFHVTNIPNSDYLCIPEISSENRFYVPIGFLQKDTLSSNRLKISDKADLFNFSIITSKVHMIWMRLVAGRLEMRYCYSIDIVYNNFVWINPSPEQKQALTNCGQDILNQREQIFAYSPQTTYADLYNNSSSANYPQLVKAHQQNDKQVLALYGLSNNATDEEILERLFALYDVRAAGQTTYEYTDKKGKQQILNLL